MSTSCTPRFCGSVRPCSQCSAPSPPSPAQMPRMSRQHLDVPHQGAAGAGGRTPGIALTYNSQAVDGRTTTTNNQGSWVGEGFSYEPGYVERQYKACADDGHETSPDLCWAYDNATISLNGRSSALVRTGDTWRFSDDDGSK